MQLADAVFYLALPKELIQKALFYFTDHLLNFFVGAVGWLINVDCEELFLDHLLKDLLPELRDFVVLFYIKGSSHVFVYNVNHQSNKRLDTDLCEGEIPRKTHNDEAY